MNFRRGPILAQTRQARCGKLKPIFKLRFSGGDLKPEKVPARELAELLVAAEEAVASLAKQRNPSLNAEDIVLGLVRIEDSSLGLVFSSPSPDVVRPAFREIASCVLHRQFAELPIRSRRCLRVLAEFGSRRQCRTQFWNGDEASPEQLAEMDVGFESALPEEKYVRGETVLYGRVERVGGVEPKVRVRLSEHEAVSCHLSEEMAKHLGKQLYSTVGLQGQATWDADDLSVIYFRVDEILPFKGGGVVEGIRELREAVDGAYDDVPDAVGFVRELRGGGEGE